jgi:hypothetical protein
MKSIRLVAGPPTSGGKRNELIAKNGASTGKKIEIT